MSQDRWSDIRRLEDWAGEVRVNLIRALAVIVFYAHHLVQVYVVGDDPFLKGRYHHQVNIVVLAWTLAVFLLFTCLSRRWVPPYLKYVSTTWDLLLITTLLMVNPDGPRSPLIFLFFVVVATSPLRLSLPLIYTATLGAMLGAAIALSHYVYFRHGADAYYAVPGLRVARSSQVVFLLAVAVAGLLAGQCVRQARRLAEGYPVEVTDETPKSEEANQ